MTKRISLTPIWVEGERFMRITVLSLDRKRFASTLIDLDRADDRNLIAFAIRMARKELKRHERWTTSPK